jgi:hypothetical protein
VSDLLLFTAKAEHDVLGHAIARFERGTFTHAALYRDGTLVEAVWPKVHALPLSLSQQARDGASEVVPLRPYSDDLDGRIWSEMLRQVVGDPYSLSTLVADVLANLIGFKTVVRMGGTLVCSVLAADYARLVHDPRVPAWLDVGSVTPADLGQMFLNRRLPRPYPTAQEASHG